MHPIIIIFLDRGLCRAQHAPNADFTLSYLLVRSPLCPLCLLHGPPLPLPFRMLGSAEPNLFEKLTFMSSVQAIRNASPYFFYLPVNLAPNMHGMC